MAEGTSQHRPALYTIERTEYGYAIRRYAARGAPATSPETPASEARGEASAASRSPVRATSRSRSGGQEVIHVRVKRGPGGEVQGRGTQDMSRMARRNPRGEFREHPAAQKATRVVRVRR